jgi:hypothetical protein
MMADLVKKDVEIGYSQSAEVTKDCRINPGRKRGGGRVFWLGKESSRAVERSVRSKKDGPCLLCERLVCSP